MPLDNEGFDSPNLLMEYRGIRGGERGSGPPSKTPLRIRKNVRGDNDKLEIDKTLMEKVAADLGVGKWFENPDMPIPVYVLSDEVWGDGGVVYVEKALFTKRGRLCGSAMGEPNATCRVDIPAYAKNKTVRELPKPMDIECTDKCPLWHRPEKPTDCRWRSITTVQLQSSPVFPSPTRFRTRGANSTRALITSLMRISDITGGVLQGIPLVLRQSHMDIFDAQRKKRRIPVVNFDFLGTIQELRAYSVRELESRKLLTDAHEGEFKPVAKTKFFTRDVGGGEELVDDFDPPADDEEEVAKEELRETQSQIALLVKRLDFTPQRLRALEDKHQGDLEAILSELRSLAPKDFDPSPGEPGEHDAVEDDAFLDF